MDPLVKKVARRGVTLQPWFTGIHTAFNHRAYYREILRSKTYGMLRRMSGRKWKSHPLLLPYVVGKCGLEIGGPSSMFRKQGPLPVYDRCCSIDLCNFSHSTIWDGTADCEQLGVPLRAQVYLEASDLCAIADQAYDFVLACHVLEHLANPLRGIREWSRVLKPGGALLVVVPDKRHTFDHKRPFTTIDHLRSDCCRNSDESDLTHLDEVLRLHDMSWCRPGETSAEFESRCLNNAALRSMHHHVFNPETLAGALTDSNLNVQSSSYEMTAHIVALGIRSGITDLTASDINSRVSKNAPETINVFRSY